MYQAAYLASKGLTFLGQLRWVGKRFVTYELFGFIAALLLNIPVLSWVFYWTNLCGSALWALEMTRATNQYLEKISELPRVYASEEETPLSDLGQSGELNQ